MGILGRLFNSALLLAEERLDSLLDRDRLPLMEESLRRARQRTGEQALEIERLKEELEGLYEENSALLRVRDAALTDPELAALKYFSRRATSDMIRGENPESWRHADALDDLAERLAPSKFGSWEIPF